MKIGLGMKLSQEQTEGKLPEPAAAHSQAGEQEKALDISGQLRHVRGWPPHTPRALEGRPALGQKDGNSAVLLPATHLSELSSLQSED